MTAWKISLRAGRDLHLSSPSCRRGVTAGALRKRYGSTVSASQPPRRARTVRGDPEPRPGNPRSGFHSHPASAEDADARTAACTASGPPSRGAGPTPSSDPRATSRCLIPTRPVRRPTAGGPPRPRPQQPRVACRGPAPDRCGCRRQETKRGPPGGAAPATTWRRGSLCRPGRQPPQPHRAPSVPARRATSHAHGREGRRCRRASHRRPPSYSARVTAGEPGEHAQPG